MTDGELIHAIRGEDREAFALFVARYQRMVEAVAFAAAGQAAIVDDVVQDTFIAAWRTIDRLEAPERARAWLCGIARNLARKARRRIRPQASTAALAAQGSPFDDVSALETSRHVAAAIATLPARYREPLVLFYYEQCTVKDIASALSLREDAVMQRLTRARRRLGEELAAVERELPKKRSRALVAAILALLPVRRAAAAPLVAARALWAVAACGAVAAVAIVATQKSAAIASAEAAKAAPKATPPAPAPTLPQASPSPAEDLRMHRALAPASIDSYETCARAARVVALSALAPDAWRTEGDKTFYEPSAEAEQAAEVAGQRAGATCGGEHWPELYVICEGTVRDILEGTVTCYPYDPFS